ncbi:HET-domain-containing protein, partial [Pseudovirgaria hyperparasitica]
MWLIEVASGSLREFIEKPPPYAILSHRWGRSEDEVQFKDLIDGRRAVWSMPGYHKIRQTCKRAREHGLGYVWIDTCCIDKSSSAELSESINSMFEYYRAAVVCFVYLNDPALESLPNPPIRISSSEWFRRAWTLQELLAPIQIKFYSKDWTFLGPRDSPFIITEIHKATSIHQRYFLQQISIESASIAERMSWAANRVATRPEDVSYSLLGIFGINMPLLYGEGRLRAFQRLQEVIIGNHDDYSVFAW